MNKADKIRRATLAAIAQRNVYVNRSAEEAAELYRRAAEQIAGQIRGDDGRHVELSELHHLLAVMHANLQRLAKQRDHELNQDLHTLALLAGMPFGGVLDAAVRQQTAQAAADFVRNFVHADGLQLSDRLWRLDRHAAETLGNHLKAAIVQGNDAYHAVLAGMGSGDGVPPHIAKAYDAARAGALRQSIRDILTGSPDPATKGGVLYQAERLFRTELIRAHGEAYMGMAFQTAGVVGVRFMLSPRHPKPDICDTHASADLYGLGAGVYPDRASCPWPAHPNTFSYVVAVFDDERRSPNPSIPQKPADMPDTVWAIRNKVWSTEFKRKAEDLYYNFSQSGIELSDHAVGRLLDPKRTQRYNRIDVEQVKQIILHTPPNFTQPDGRAVIFDAGLQLAIVISENDSSIVTVVRRKYAGKTWKRNS
ncbi:hypothetical protein V6667_06565 [Neisseria leonii]|uniref:Uncharacterized protein n=1 Tax=Neisseria leonii TaxID=2995413 RepID=A0A9X4E2T6_9NEIS|nr:MULTISPECIES: hypothetical protein [unclassified Neisseria]MDD9324762.1 hypothetical protein [Neisseria sp. 3986]MDD9327675.1 hypothetical protein [Neisseria sp. 51.81]